MPSFADSFWSTDYAGGLGVLFSKLKQGVIENQQVVMIASLRADAEEAYSKTLEKITLTVDGMSGGFTRDDGASVRKVKYARNQALHSTNTLQAYDGVCAEMTEASKNHQKIASNIRELVVTPFLQWSKKYAEEIQKSQNDLHSRIKAHDRQAEVVQKLRSQYFNKCRLMEDMEEENKLAFQDPEKEQPAQGSPKPLGPPKLVLPEDESDDEPIEIGDEYYYPEQVKKLLKHMLETIKMGETQVQLLGLYQNTSSGTDIADYIQKNMNATSVSYAERIGQDLVDAGFLRLIGNLGSTFANSSRMSYQWRVKAWRVAGLSEAKKPLNRVGSLGPRVGSGSPQDRVSDSPVVGAIAETLQTWNPLNNPHPNETPAARLRRESKEADEKYKAGVIRLDFLRCNLEEAMIFYFKFLEQYELDRLKGIRRVVLDFSGAISNVIPTLQSQVDNMMLYQETIQPLGDLRYMLENYRTGAYAPKVVPYENYYGSVDEQTFGVDLEARARADRKRVPMVITTILTFLDTHYPDLEGDKARRDIWLVDVPLSDTHHLRNAINNGKAIQKEVLEPYEIPIVASVLKLYLLELPGKPTPTQDSSMMLIILDSLVSSQVYEIIKTIYATTTDATPNPISTDAPDSAPRIKVLQSTLGQLRLNNIATLDAITTHFTRLIDLTSADETYVASLAQTLAPCILRPRAENALTMYERHAYRLIRDLFDHKEAIFGELKRQSSSLGGLGGAAAVGPKARPRAVSSTDESNRRAAMEARQKAIAEQRTRDRSPAPANRHKRDRSTDGSMGRFPVVASPQIGTGQSHTSTTRPSLSGQEGVHRHSLEVPGTQDTTPVMEKTAKPLASQIPNTFHFQHNEATMTTNGTASMPGAFSQPPTPPEKDLVPSAVEANVEKKDSLKRSTVGSGGRGKHRIGAGSSGTSSILARGKGSLSERQNLEWGNSPQGVTLQDRPMDD
jgi:Domain found in Dishevelled, Egl-10, and Pleckstrin (DEP)/RhoGAP domain/Fes/CIP4, and EFC/F-BAR homology domain